MRSDGLVWDSGRVESNSTLDIPYGGPAPLPGQRLWWRVETWSSDDRRAVSAPAFFETAPRPQDWAATWLASEHPLAAADRAAGLHWLEVAGLQSDTAVRGFRFSASVPSTTQADFLLSANKLDGVWLNGQAVRAEGEEAVSWTTIAQYRLTLMPGANVIAVTLKKAAGFGVVNGFASILRLPDATGGLTRLTSAEGWKTALEPAEGWQSPAFDASAWDTATIARRKPAGEPWPAYPAMHLRRAFKTGRRVRSARLYATALGCYEAWINGVRVGDQMLAPEMTDTHERVLFQAHDVTDLLRRGDNALGFWVGDGWYGSEFSSISRYSFGPPPNRVLARLDIEYEDGGRDSVVTGEGWRTAPSPVVSSEIYDGEIYDARLEIAGWSRAGFDDSGWAQAVEAPAPEVAVEPQEAPPVRITQTLKAVSITEPTPGVHVFDFGQNFAGWPRLKVRGQAGDRVEMRFAENLQADGQVDQSNLRSAFARDAYILKGGGDETWTPRFTYHGFRYVQVSGLRGRPTVDTLQGLVGHNDLAFTGLLRVGDPVVEKFWRNAVWSQRSNFFGLPTDCPQRDERLGWMGDAEVFWPAAAYNMDVQAYSARVMGDIRHGQSSKGGFPDVIPPFFVGLELTSPGWSDAGIVLPHTAWMHYGDTGIVRENWDAMQRHMAWIESQNPNHLWAKARGADYGDWLAVDAVQPGDPTTPKDLVGTAYWARCAAMMAQMAEATGQTDDAARYLALFDAIRAAFRSAFVKADGSIGNGSQTSYILPIRFGLLDPAGTADAGRRLAADIHRRNDTLSTGFLGTPHILDALVDSGQAEVAVTLLLQRQFPSWGYMVTKGATTMWERWNSDTGDVAMNSYNHYAFGAIGDFLFRRVAGVDAAAPGFSKVRVAPVVDARLGFGGADYASASGLIRTDWKIEGDRLRLDVELPAGVSAEVVLPASASSWTHDGAPVVATGPYAITGGRHRFLGQRQA